MLVAVNNIVQENNCYYQLWLFMMTFWATSRHNGKINKLRNGAHISAARIGLSNSYSQVFFPFLWDSHGIPIPMVISTGDP